MVLAKDTNVRKVPAQEFLELAQGQFAQMKGIRLHVPAINLSVRGRDHEQPVLSEHAGYLEQEPILFFEMLDDLERDSSVEAPIRQVERCRGHHPVLKVAA